MRSIAWGQWTVKWRGQGIPGRPCLWKGECYVAEEPQEPELIVLDVDGTLLNSQHAISP